MRRAYFSSPRICNAQDRSSFAAATNRLLIIPETDRGNGVVAFSSGNHAQGVAAAAAALGIRATIVMPADAPRTKMAGTRALGAEIVTYDRHREDREAIAQRICDTRSAVLVRPFDDAGMVAGQGTMGLEIAQDVADLDIVAVPCSGGGLVSGVALALSKASPNTRVFSVEPQGSMECGFPWKVANGCAATATGISIAEFTDGADARACAVWRGAGNGVARHQRYRRGVGARGEFRVPAVEAGGGTRRQRRAGSAACRKDSRAERSPSFYRAEIAILKWWQVLR